MVRLGNTRAWKDQCVCARVWMIEAGGQHVKERSTMIFGTGSLIGSQGSQITLDWLAKGSQGNFCFSVSNTGIASTDHQGQLFTRILGMNLSSSWFTVMDLTNWAIVPAPKETVWSDIDSVNYGCFLIHMRKCCQVPWIIAVKNDFQEKKFGKGKWCWAWKKVWASGVYKHGCIHVRMATRVLLSSEGSMSEWPGEERLHCRRGCWCSPEQNPILSVFSIHLCLMLRRGECSEVHPRAYLSGIPGGSFSHK